MKLFLKSIFILLLLIQTIFSDEINLTKEEKEFLRMHPQLSVGETSTFKPLFVKDLNGNISGVLPDMYDLIGSKLGIKFKYIDDDWFSILENHSKNQIDIIGAMNKTTAKKRGFSFIESPFSFYTAIFRKINSNITIEKEEDLNGLRIAYFKKIVYIDSYLKQKSGITLVKTNSPLEAFNAVVQGKADVMMGMNYDSYLLLESSIVEIEPAFILNNLKADSVISIRKDYYPLKSIFEKVIKSLSHEEKNKILSKWMWIPNGKQNIKSKKYNKNINLNEEEKKYLEKNPILKVQGLATFPPFNFSQNGRASGYSIDYLKLIGKYLDVDIEFTKSKSFGETISMFKAGEIDILPHIARNKKREEFIDYTNFNHIEYNIGIAIRKDETISSMEDLEDKTIAVVNKTFIQAFLKKNYPNQKIISFSSTNDAVEAVSLGKADALIGSIPTMNFYIQKNWLSNVRTTKINDIGLSNKVSMPMGVQKNNKVLKSILEKANLAIPHNEIVKLKEKWLNIDIHDESTLLLTEEEKSYLLKKEKIKMCVLPNWLPFEQIDENGNHKGVGADIVKIISKELNIPFELIQTKEWSKSLQNIRDRKCDILPVAMDIPSRRDAMNFTRPYDAEPFVIATKNDAIFIKDSKEIGSKKVGIVKSYAFIEVLKQRSPGIEIISVKNAKDGLERVRSGELFGYIDIVPAIIYTMQQNSLVDLKISGKLEFDIKLSMASRNDEPLLNSILEKSLNTISEDKIRNIVGKWLSVKVEQRVDYTLLWQVSLFFILIIFIVLYKNREVNILNTKLIDASKEIAEQQDMVNKHVMILTTDLKGKITYVNEAYCEKVGYEIDEMIGSDHNIIRHPDMSKEFFKKMWEDISLGKNWSGEIKNLTKAKDSVYFNVVIEPLVKNGKKVGYRSISDDITDKKRIEELSITDKLTGLYNRLKIDESLEKQVNLFNRYKTPFSIILLDIDNFKSINDNYGHDTGDYALMEVAKVLKENIRKTDEVGRWGGEEFIIICTNIDLNGAYTLAEHVRKAIEEKEFNKIGKMTASLGVSTFSDSDNLDSIFKRVDNALYEAKHNGKNQTVV